MLTQDQVIEAIAFAIQDPLFNLNSNRENTEAWDSLGEVTILATLAKLTVGKSDQIPDLYKMESALELISMLREHGLIA